ncbi:hypothetical protein [Sediminibacterium sp.]|uniref:hypothetical protein n=1 Tax=Sediminibacterium sp. TaxID=1917865 RepID=UPI003F6F5C4F
MNQEEFVKKFAEQFDETDKSVFTLDTVFKDLEEWSSMLALSIIAMVDQECNVSITGAEIVRASTIFDLFQIVESKK